MKDSNTLAAEQHQLDNEISLEQEEKANEEKQAMIDSYVQENLHNRIKSAGAEFKEALAGEGLGDSSVKLLAYLISYAIESNYDNGYRIVGKLLCHEIRDYITPILEGEVND